MKSPNPIRVLIVDDHFMVRLGLLEAINAEPDMQVVGEASDGQGGIALHQQLRPDVTLMDERLPGEDGIHATEAILRAVPDARVAILTISENEESIYRAFKAGVSGYFPKSMDRQELLDGIRSVHNGSTFFPPRIRERLERRLARPGLTPRETEILPLIARGLSNKEIGAALGISEPTVKLHIRNTIEKLNAMDRTEAATVAIQRGLLRLD